MKVNIFIMYVSRSCHEQEPAHVSMATVSRRRDGHAPKKKKQACARLSDSSECSTTVAFTL